MICVAERYRYTGTTLYRDGGVVEAGEVIEPTDAELEAFGDALELVQDSAPVEEKEDDASPVESPPIDPAEFTVADLTDALEDEDYDWTPAALRGLREAEQDGDGRETALDAIDAALEAATE